MPSRTPHRTVEELQRGNVFYFTRYYTLNTLSACVVLNTEWIERPDASGGHWLLDYLRSGSTRPDSQLMPTGTLLRLLAEHGDPDDHPDQKNEPVEPTPDYSTPPEPAPQPDTPRRTYPAEALRPGNLFVHHTFLPGRPPAEVVGLGWDDQTLIYYRDEPGGPVLTLPCPRRETVLYVAADGRPADHDPAFHPVNWSHPVQHVADFDPAALNPGDTFYCPGHPHGEEQRMALYTETADSSFGAGAHTTVYYLEDGAPMEHMYFEPKETVTLVCRAARHDGEPRPAVNEVRPAGQSGSPAAEPADSAATAQLKTLYLNATARYARILAAVKSELAADGCARPDRLYTLAAERAYADLWEQVARTVERLDEFHHVTGSPAWEQAARDLMTRTLAQILAPGGGTAEAAHRFVAAAHDDARREFVTVAKDALSRRDI